MPRINLTSKITGRPTNVISRLISSILRVSRRDKTRRFYIGRTIDLEKRLLQHDQKKGPCRKMKVLYKTSSTNYIVQIEENLINNFLDHPKCLNKANQSSGSLKEGHYHYIYVLIYDAPK